jgi:ABC-type sugar transport system ATPase subunit
MNRFRSVGLKLNFPEYEITCDDFDVAPGEWLEIKAPSGFGKTTLMRALLGLQKMSGQLWLGESQIDSKPLHQRNFGVVFQDQLLFPHLSALDNALFGLQLRGRITDEHRAQAEAAFRKLGLLERIHAPIQELSGGERQRLALIRAILFSPVLLILDEPFKGLDPKTSDQMLDFLRSFLSGHSIPVVWISHQSDVEIHGKQLIGGHQNGSRHFTFHHQ